MRIRFRYLAIFIVFCIIYNQGYSQTLRINELMSSNLQVIKDEDGDFSDWIELINAGSSTINLTNYYLSDDLNNPSQWHFPSYSLDGGDILLVFASGKDKKDLPSNWQTIIDKGDEWRYILPSEEIPNWRDSSFNDSSWQTGNSGFGYEDGDDTTVIPSTLSIYLRKVFTIDDLASINEIILHMDYDDAFVAYVNGTEVVRSNIGTKGIYPTYNEGATVGHEARMYQDYSPEEFKITDYTYLLTEGNNLLAVEVHNQSIESSDFTAIPFLSVRSSAYTENSPSALLNLPPSYFHTNFKLSSGGDSLFIHNIQLQLTDQLIYEPFPVNYSIGYKDNNFNELSLFGAPTPEMANTSEAVIYDGELIPIFSQEGGIYTSSISLTLSSANIDDEIYYTTDGSEPDFSSTVYSSSITLNSPTSVKAKILRTDQTYGKTITQSYLPYYDKELPVVFISTEPQNLWSEEDGIYTLGTNAETSFPYLGANFWQDWEKPAHVELFFPYDKPGFSVDAGIKIHGGGSRVYNQKSITTYARSMYGDKNISSQVFDEKSIDKFESITFRNSGNDWLGTYHSTGSMFRDMMMSNIALRMDLDASAGMPAVMYLNGDYWGIYNIREKLREQFIASNHNLNTDEFDMLEFYYSVINGSKNDYLTMYNFIEANDISQSGNYNYLKTQMDIQNFIRYQTAEIFFDNWDWPGNNIKFWKDYTEAGRWRWIVHDTDFGFGLNSIGEEHDTFYSNTLIAATATDGEDWPNPPWSTLILRKLLANSDFQNEFINTFADHLNTSLKTETTLNLIEHYSTQIEQEIPLHTEKWGSTNADWLSNVDLLKEFSQVRPDTVRGFIREYFSISQNQNVSIAVDGCDNASIQVNTININQFPWEGIYFNQIPIELTALAPSGYEFMRWEGDVSSTNAKIQISMDSDINVTAVFDENPDALGIIINEIAYNPSDEYDSKDWVELYNNSSNFVNISGWILKDSNDDNKYKINANTILEPYAHIVVCRDPDAFSLIYPNTTNYQGPLGFGFSSSGECIRLYDNIGTLIDSVCFSAESPWPTEPNGNGYTLSLADPDSDNSLSQNWFTSGSLAGTPGTDNTITGTEELTNNTTQSFLLQNFPNPVNESTFIPLYSHNRQNINLSIYNIQGQLISIIYEGKLDKGYHTFEWNASDLNSGMYLINYSGSDHESFKKMIINPQ